MKFSIDSCCTLFCLFFFALVTFAATSTPAAKAPHELAGFKLDSFIGDYDEMPIYHTFLQEIVVSDVDGFRKGSIFHGVCAEQGEIIKMHFQLNCILVWRLTAIYQPS